MLTDIQKSEIQSQLAEYVKKTGSQAQAADKIGVSQGTLISIKRTEEWSKLSDDKWRQVSKMIGYKGKKRVWNTSVVTSNTLLLTELFDEAREDCMVYAIVNQEGSGKTQTTKDYVEKNENTFHIECADYWNHKEFLQSMAHKMGIDHRGRVTDLMKNIWEAVLKMESVLFVIDEADKLNDRTFYSWITFINKLEDHCGIVFMATPYLETRLKRGHESGRKGFSELWSRMGRKCVPLNKISGKEVIAICQANGYYDQEGIESIIKECQGDLRRVKKSVTSRLRLAEKKASQKTLLASQN